MTDATNHDDWLAQVSEEIIDPLRPIIAPHHHLWRRGPNAYLLPELHADTGSGHNVTQTVFIECHSEYLEEGPKHLRPVGETAFVADIAKQSVGSGAAVISAIVAHADLRLGERLGDVLDAHREAGAGLLRGIRHAGAHVSNPEGLLIPGRAPEGLYADPAFREGV